MDLWGQEPEESSDSGPESYYVGAFYRINPFFKAVGLRNIQLIREQLRKKSP